MRFEVSEIIKKDRVMELVFGNCSKPTEILGRHITTNGQIISAYHPDAVKMEVLAENGAHYPMDAVERQPVFALFLSNRKKFPYKLRVEFRDGNECVWEDPYRFGGLITEEEEEQFAKGNWTDAYRKLGCHRWTVHGTDGMYFAVWAPSAKRVSVVGDFNFWNGMIHPMERRDKSGIFELFIPGLADEQLYKFEIKEWQGNVSQRADPYAVMNEDKPDGASKIFDMSKFLWEDSHWMTARTQRDFAHEPLGLCEASAAGIDFPAEKIREMAKDIGCTHILLKTAPGISGSGSRQRGIFEPVLGGSTPDKTRSFVNECHKAGIGVVMEISPGYFKEGRTGLDQFDGTPLYTVSDDRISEGKAENIRLFNNEQAEVSNYLLSNLLFWIREYHIDGFVFRTISQTIALKKDKFNSLNIKEQEEFQTLLAGYSEFLHRAKRLIKTEDFSVLFIGEEMRDKGMCGSFHGSGFYDFEWNYHLKNSVSDWLYARPERKREEYFKLTLPVMRGDLSHTLLPLNGDAGKNFEKPSVDKKEFDDYSIERMDAVGEGAERRLVYGFLMGMPGKKACVLHPLGKHAGREYMKALFRIYVENSALSEYDPSRAPFEWINGMDAKNLVVSFLRKAPAGRDGLLFVCNFDTQAKEDYQLGVPRYGRYVMILNSDAKRFGGAGRFENQQPFAVQEYRDLRPYSIKVSLPPQATLIFKY